MTAVQQTFKIMAEKETENFESFDVPCYLISIYH